MASRKTVLLVKIEAKIPFDSSDPASFVGAQALATELLASAKKTGEASMTSKVTSASLSVPAPTTHPVDAGTKPPANLAVQK